MDRTQVVELAAFWKTQIGQDDIVVLHYTFNPPTDKPADTEDELDLEEQISIATPGSNLEDEMLGTYDRGIVFTSVVVITTSQEIREILEALQVLAREHHLVILEEMYNGRDPLKHKGCGQVVKALQRWNNQLLKSLARRLTRKTFQTSLAPPQGE